MRTSSASELSLSLNPFQLETGETYSLSKMKQNFKAFWRNLTKQNQFIVKLGISILFVGLAFRLLFSRSTTDISSSDVANSIIPLLEDSVNPVQEEVFTEESRIKDKIPPKDNGGKCDLSTGDWIPDKAGPAYTNKTCKWIENHQNCMTNGRPDTGYVNWRWKPRDCELPQFNAERFLELMRNKHWALVGDSITRNHIQSLLCILSKVEQAVQVYHDREYKSRRWHFPSHNFTISVIWSPFLSKAAIFEDIDGVSTSEIKLHLDVLDKTWTDQYKDLDYLIFSSGKWFIKTAIYYEKGEILGCHYCQGKNYTNLDFNFAYRKILKNLFNFIMNSEHKGVIFYRTSTPDHFEDGEWSSGGTCKRKKPAKEGDFELKEINRLLREIELDEFEKAAAEASEKGNSVNPVPEVFTESSTIKDKIPPKGTGGKCDLFTGGDWIPDKAAPAYTNKTCKWIENQQNCMTNGRPDIGYVNWRWKPRDCKLPLFHAETFLELMRKKSWMFIGDSITRNHLQSLLCILSTVEPAIEVFDDTDYKYRKWHFPSYNFFISFIWSPFLAKAAIPIDDLSTSEIKLHLDILDKTWTDLYKDTDYIIVSSGLWFIKTAIYYERGEILGCNHCQGKNYTVLDFNFAYRKILVKLFNFIMNSGHKGTIFYRTSTPEHFEDGDWDSGGHCKRKKPAKDGDFKLKILSRILREVELDEFGKAATKASEKGIKLKLLDVNPLCLLRPDAHPGPYQNFQPFAENKNAKVQNDCMHWCLPGPIDHWNDLLMEILVNG